MTTAGQTVVISGIQVTVSSVFSCMYRGFSQLIGYGGGKKYHWIEWLDGKRSKVFCSTDLSYAKAPTQ